MLYDIYEVEFKMAVKQILTDIEYKLFTDRFEYDIDLETISDESGVPLYVLEAIEHTMLTKLETLYI